MITFLYDITAEKEGEKEVEVDFLLEELSLVSSSLLSGEMHTDAVQRWGRQCANPGERERICHDHLFLCVVLCCVSVLLSRQQQTISNNIM